MKFREDIDALILGCLSAGPAHGYEISKRIRQLSDEALSVAEGKLYPALHQLEQTGDITSSWVPQGNKPPRKVYEITEQGRHTLKRKQQQWKAFAAGVGTVLMGTSDLWVIRVLSRATSAGQGQGWGQGLGLGLGLGLGR